MCLSMLLLSICLFSCFVRVVDSEELVCEEKHRFKGDENDGFVYGKKYCSYETFGQRFSSKDCKIVEYDGSEQCSNLQFTTTSSSDLTKLLIFPRAYGYSNFNITFKRNHWKYMRYRLQHKTDKDNNSCMEMYLNDGTDVSNQTAFSFTCRKFGQIFEGTDAEFYFSVGDSPAELQGGGHFFMKIPKLANIQNDQDNIDSWQLLVVLDVSHLPVVRIFWPLAPARFNVSGYSLNVTTSANDSDDWKVFKLQQVDSSSCEDGVCLQTIFLGYGTYKFKATVQMIDEKCKPNLCISESVIAFVVAGLPLYLWLTIILLPLAILIVLIVSLGYYCMRIWKDHPTVLILYKPTERQHCYAVSVLVEFLEAVYGVQCLLYKESQDEDVGDAPIDLSSWWKDAFFKADVVMVIASPPCCNYFQYFRNPGTAECGFSELENQLRVKKLHKRFLVAVPRYCTAVDVPSEGKELPHFYLPADFGLLSLYMHCPDGWAMKLVKLVRGVSSWCCCLNLLSGYRKYGADLEDAWKTAEAVRRLMGPDIDGHYPSTSEIPDLGSVPEWPPLEKMNLAPSTVSKGCTSVRIEEDDDFSVSCILNQLELK